MVVHLVPAVSGRQDDASHITTRAKGFPYPLQHNRFYVILLIPPAGGHKHALVAVATVRHNWQQINMWGHARLEELLDASTHPYGERVERFRPI